MDVVLAGVILGSVLCGWRASSQTNTSWDGAFCERNVQRQPNLTRKRAKTEVPGVGHQGQTRTAEGSRWGTVHRPAGPLPMLQAQVLRERTSGARLPTFAGLRKRSSARKPPQRSAHKDSGRPKNRSQRFPATEWAVFEPWQRQKQTALVPAWPNHGKTAPKVENLLFCEPKAPMAQREPPPRTW